MSERIYFDKNNPVPESLAEQLTPFLEPMLDFNRRALPKEGIIKRNVELTLEGEVYIDNILGHADFKGVFILKHDGDIKMRVPVIGNATRE